jgi:hypothetical protein
MEDKMSTVFWALENGLVSLCGYAPDGSTLMEIGRYIDKDCQIVAISWAEGLYKTSDDPHNWKVMPPVIHRQDDIKDWQVHRVGNRVMQGHERCGE